VNCAESGITSTKALLSVWQSSVSFEVFKLNAGAEIILIVSLSAHEYTFLQPKLRSDQTSIRVVFLGTKRTVLFVSLAFVSPKIF
jgi:hypothetical protein